MQRLYSPFAPALNAPRGIPPGSLPSGGLYPGRLFLGALLVTGLIAGLVAWLPPVPPAHAQSPPTGDIAEKRGQLKELKKEKNQIRRQLEEFRVSEDDSLVRIRELSSRIREIKGRTRRLSAQRKKQQRLLAGQQAEIERLTGLIAQTRERVERHMRRLYRLSKIGDSAALFALAPHREFFKDVQLISLLVRADREAVARFQSLRARLAEKQQNLRHTLGRLSKLEQQLSAEQAELRKSRDRLKRSLAEMRKNRSLYRKYMQDLEQLERGMEAAVVNLERQAGEQRLASQVPDTAALRGHLSAPVKGRLLAAFGRQDPRYNLKKFQRGIVVRVADSAPVSAAAPGKVVHAGPFRGYQQLVVLDHGQGLFTVYGHLENLLVEKGKRVSAGMILGRATFQPVGDAYEIYFELRWKGRPEDPLKWLKPGALKLPTSNGSNS